MLGVCCSSMLCDYGCVFCFISFLFVYMCQCVCMPLSSRSIAGVSAFEPGASGATIPKAKRQEILSLRRPRSSGYCTPPVCVPDVIGGLAVWRHNQKKHLPEKKQNLPKKKSATPSTVQQGALSRCECVSPRQRWRHAPNRTVSAVGVAL